MDDFLQVVTKAPPLINRSLNYLVFVNDIRCCKCSFFLMAVFYFAETGCNEYAFKC